MMPKLIQANKVFSSFFFWVLLDKTTSSSATLFPLEWFKFVSNLPSHLGQYSARLWSCINLYAMYAFVKQRNNKTHILV